MAAKSYKKSIPGKTTQPNNPTLVMLVQQIKGEFWTQAAGDPAFALMLDEAHAANAMQPKSDPARIKRLRAAANAIGAYVVLQWTEDGCEVTEAHAILHGDDVQDEWCEEQQGNIKTPKHLHIHLLVKFKSRSTSKPVARLGTLAGIPANQISIGGQGGDDEAPRKGGAMVEVCGTKISRQHDNGLAYLIHIKYLEKFQYPPTQVATVCGMDYMRVYAERREAWMSGRAFIKKRRALENVEQLREKVLQGEVTKSQILLTDELFEIYSRHQREIDDAFDAYGQRRAIRAAVKLQRGDFTTNVVFIHGGAGVGKTKFAQSFIGAAMSRAAAHGERWEMYRAATGNPLDDWRGEEVLLLDDLRASAMDANDWLLLMDPHNASPARARYRNKQAVAPRLIVITATIDPVTFFFFARKKGEVDEALDQFIRRVASIVEVYRQDDIVRYLVNTTGQVEPYRRQIETGKGWRDQPEYERVSLTYGGISKVDHSEEGAVAALVVGVAGHSPDIPFDRSEDWDRLTSHVAIESRIHDLETELATSAR